jgi:hypothetical protein
MEVKQNPFSVYDFLGYFTPGALFLFAAMASYRHLFSNATTFEGFAQSIGLNNAEAYVPFVLLAYTSGHILSFISSITIERYSLWAMGYPSKYLLGLEHSGYYSINENIILRYIIRTIVFILILPMSFPELVFGRLFGLRDLYAKKIDPLLIEIIQNKIYALVRTDGGIREPEKRGTTATSNYFLYAYHYAVENAPNHLPKMQNYVALYGFLRTLTLLSVFIFWAIIFHIALGMSASVYIWILLAISVLISYLLFMAFVKFYCRFSFETLMAMSIVYHEKTKKG